MLRFCGIESEMISLIWIGFESFHSFVNGLTKPLLNIRNLDEQNKALDDRLNVATRDGIVFFIFIYIFIFH